MLKKKSNVLDETVKKLLLLKTGLSFLKFCDKMGITHKPFLQHTPFCSRMTVSEKSICGTVLSC